MTRTGGIRRLDRTRVEFDDSLSPRDIAGLLEEPDLKVLQSPAPVKDAVWLMLNERFFASRPDVQLRAILISRPARSSSRSKTVQ